MVYITPLDLLSSFMLIQMLTRQVIRLIDTLSYVSVSCYILLLSRGTIRSRMWFLVPVRRLSIVPLPTPLASLFGFAGLDSASIRSFQHFLSQHFEMKDLGTLSYFLGLEVTSSFDGYYLSQTKYASDLLSKVGITDNKIVSTFLEYNAKLTPLDGEPIFDATHYRQLVGNLIYLTVTCLNISHAVGMVSKFMDVLRSVHYTTFLRIL